MFTDKIQITIKAGKGGDGRLGFRHEKYRAMGGPDGGDGGRGGDVVVEVTHNLHTLSAFRKKRLVKAADGEMGGGDRRHGKNGDNSVVYVPAGTQIVEDGVILADLTEEGQTAIIAKGGRGGFGNAHFTSSTRQAPRIVEVGEQGQHKIVTLELKLVADVGLVGLPNAGKSTLLSVISNAKPEIGDYPFTTLTPNLGVVDYKQFSFLVADIPGLIEGASEGKGLGDEFLRHIERTAVILHLVDAYSEDVVADYNTIQGELRQYSVDLTQKAQLVILTKTEGMPKDELDAKMKQLKKAVGSTVYTISAIAHTGIDVVLAAAVPLVQAARTVREEEIAVEAIPVIDESTQPNLWQITLDKKVYVITGDKLEGFARRTAWDNDDSVTRMRDILHKEGVDRELARRQVEPGATLRIAGNEFEWLGN